MISEKTFEKMGAAVREFFEQEMSRRSVMTYGGVWQRDVAYTRGQVVTHKNSLWIGVVGSKGSCPGRTTDWRLIARAGSAPS